MPAQVERHVVRIAFDITKYGEAVIEKISGETPQIWRGNDVRFEVVVMRDGAVLDVANLASLTLEVRDAADIDGTPQMQKTVAGGAMDNTVTDATWADDTKQHATFDFTDTETNLTSPGDDYLSNWQVDKFIVLSGITSGGNVITYQTGKIIFREDGAGSAGTPPTNDPNYYTQAQTDAGFVQKTGATMTGLLVLSADPSAALGAATKQYVDAATSNGAWKKPVRAASTANVDIASAPSSIDGVTLANGDRVLLKDQSSGLQNGIRVFTAAGAALSRSSDCNSSALCEPGFCVRVNEGTANADRAFALTTNATITLDTTALVFTQVSALGQVTLATGLTKTTNELEAWHASTHATPAGVDVTTDGAAATPAIARSTDLNTGLYFPAADQVALTAGGTARVTANTTGGTLTGAFTASTSLTTPLSLLSADGAAATPAIARSTDLNTGLYFPAADQVALTAGGTARVAANTTGVDVTGVLGVSGAANITGLLSAAALLRVNDGAAAAPSLAFTAETDTGLFRSAAGVLGFAFSGVERAKLGETGSNLELEIPTYNLILDTPDTTAGRGNLGLMGSSTFGTGASGVVSLGPVKTEPSAGSATHVIAWNRTNATSGKSELVIDVDGTQSCFGEYVGIGRSEPEHSVEIDGNSCWFLSDVASDIYFYGFSSGANDGVDIHVGRGRGTEAGPNQIQSGDRVATFSFQGIHDFGTFGTGAAITLHATEAFTSAALGTKMVFQTCLTGVASLTDRLQFDGLGNFLCNAAAAPTTMAKGVALADGTAASANPTSAVAFWSASGVWQYRTSAASEGAGQTNYVHNRAEQVTGSGTDYTLTNATARVDFGTTDPQVTLPTAGTYLITAEVAVTNGATATDNYQAKFYNSTDAAEVAGSPREVGAAAASQKLVIPLSAIVTVTASKTIQLYAHNTVAARGTIVSTQTAIRYVRLH
jgi:hypothetical protein